MSDIVSQKTKAKIVVIVDWIIFSISTICFILGLIFYESLVKYLTEIAHKKAMETAVLYHFASNVGEDGSVAYSPDEFEKIRDRNWNQQEKLVRTALTIYIVIFIIGLLIKLALNILLTRGVRQENAGNCNTWVSISSIFFILGLLNLIYKLFQLFAGSVTILAFTGDFVFLIWIGLSLYFVKCFIESLGQKVSYCAVCVSCIECC